VLIDIGEIQQDKVKTNLEGWYEILKTVVKLAENYSRNNGSNSQKDNFDYFLNSEVDKNDADDFYVFLYDEEESKAQKTLKRGKI
jgi:hypothetical protein